jgi:hypothetical protein
VRPGWSSHRFYSTFNYQWDKLFEMYERERLSGGITMTRSTFCWRTLSSALFPPPVRPTTMLLGSWQSSNVAKSPVSTKQSVRNLSSSASAAPMLSCFLNLNSRTRFTLISHQVPGCPGTVTNRPLSISRYFIGLLPAYHHYRRHATVVKEDSKVAACLRECGIAVDIGRSAGMV